MSIVFVFSLFGMCMPVSNLFVLSRLLSSRSVPRLFSLYNSSLFSLSSVSSLYGLCLFVSASVVCVLFSIRSDRPLHNRTSPMTIRWKKKSFVILSWLPHHRDELRLSEKRTYRMENNTQSTWCLHTALCVYHMHWRALQSGLLYVRDEYIE